ncbi:MAG: EAL domain-containing protein [Burkholderiales bacterium]|nr:EAL domain-containing protein [Burkholderiales bacterium]
MTPARIATLNAIPFRGDQALLQNALEAGGVGLWDYTPADGMIDLYHNVLSFVSLRPGRYYGPIDAFTRHVASEDAATIERLLRQCRSGKPEVYAEVRVRRSSGDGEGTVWLACNARNAARAGEAPRYVGTLTDITDASERELKLLAYHESLFSLARNPMVADRGDFARSSRQILRQCAHALGVTRVGLWRCSDDGRRLTRQYQFDARTHNGSTEHHPTQTRTAAKHPSYFAAIAQRRLLAASDARGDPALSDFRGEYVEHTGVLSVLDVPVLHHGQLWGVVCFEDCVRTRVWDTDARAYASSAVDLLSLALEVADRVRSEAELHATRERHRAFIQASLDSIWAVDVDPPIDIKLPAQEQLDLLRAHGTISDVNAAFARDYDALEHEVIGQRLAEFMPELFRGNSLRDWISRNYRLSEREMRLKVSGEERRWLTLTLLGVVENGRLVRLWGARRNVTDRKRYQSLLEHLAFRDPLTGLLNRQRLVAEVTDAIEQMESMSDAPSAALLLLDLNQFKDINDTLGHGAGDDVLRQMKTRLRKAIADENAVAARLGGDEFGVFVRGVATAEGAMRVGEAITAALAPPFVIAGGKFHVSASIGAAIYPTHGRSFAELSRAADEAMYHAKQTGGGVRLFSRSTVVFEKRKLLLLADLPEAIERGELELEFQPIIHCLTRKPVRLEALVRWNHPEYGRLTARDFVHRAEMSDSIRILTRWVIDHGLAAARDWQASAPGVGLAINISPRLLGDSIIVAHLQRSIREHGLPARLIDLEITETSLIHNSSRATQILADCRAQGFSVIIDDYGVGFCSLAYLRRLPLKGLKMDKSFVSRVMQNAEDAIIVQSTIALAHNLGLTVVAEGVEDAATLQFLELHGCDFAQGYGIAHPLSLNAVTDWLKSANPPPPPPANSTLRAVS